MIKTTNEHPKAAQQFLKDAEKAKWHDKALWFVREKRDKAVNQIPDWEQLREHASSIKAHVLSNLDNYLIEFEKNAQNNGVQVHWASDAKEANQIVLSIMNQNKAQKLVKSKSMLTEECELNHFLEEKGIEVVDTDLGERIVQLAKEPPSHIVLPAIHKKKEEVDELFQEHLGTKPSGGNPEYLTHQAREHLRRKFLDAEVTITGVNFAVAETGGFVVCTNEGNADMGAHSAPVHIACMGIEKLVPKQKDLAVFLRLLARNATGQPITTYSSHFKKPRTNQQMHIVLVDNGRSEHLGKEDFRNALKCIRCGACMNTCPVYRRSGGYSYNYIIPGPIGAILSPNRDLKKYSSLPFASTLCGSCTEVCPVKIDIHNQLYKWRQEITKEKSSLSGKALSMKFMGKMFASPKMYKNVARIGKQAARMTPKALQENKLNKWSQARAMPPMPKESFDDWFKKNVKAKTDE